MDAFLVVSLPLSVDVLLPMKRLARLAIEDVGVFFLLILLGESCEGPEFDSSFARNLRSNLDLPSFYQYGREQLLN